MFFGIHSQQQQVPMQQPQQFQQGQPPMQQQVDNEWHILNS